ncbi:hypothetical protein [Variovorax paradoxus]|uniref:Uncharacterized protein n=1 Tax=Variovorax paradoxus TaxID=34073 RepID=A0A679J2G8_VARPD|nr:hypothetical protein VVAX_03778 [Variovorax paradoxus]
MSHPVYLSSSPLPRMPEGSRNEWRGFFGSGAELEANAFFPLFWRALFSEDDIRCARFIDEYDIDNEDAATDREECLQDFGPEATYPYLVIDTATALARLSARREDLIAAIGERYRPIHDAFEAFVAQGFPHHILLRTQGLPDAADAQPWLRAELAAVDNPSGSGALAPLLKDLARHDTDPVWTLAGLGSSADEAWPPDTLRECFPDPRRRKRADARSPSLRQLPDKPHRPRSWLDPALEWLGAFAAAGAALGAYLFTRSGWLAALAFLCVAVASGFGIARLLGSRY